MMDENNRLSLFQNLRLKLVLWAIPPYVLPRATIRFFYHKFFNIRCPSQVDLIRNSLIRWMGSSLDYQLLRQVTSAADLSTYNLADNVVLSDQKAIISKIPEVSFHAFWIPQIPDSNYVLFYIHGGGFSSGSTAGCAKYLIQIAEELCLQGLKCSILSVDYDLSPEAQYPKALRQISEAYDYVLSLHKKVILVGDSAGGNLCLSLLRHIHTPHHEIKVATPQRIPDLLVMVSPWVDLLCKGDSVRKNGVYDCIDKPTLDRWSKQYIGRSRSMDKYTHHLNEKISWRDVLPAETLMVAGEFECFASEIHALARNFENDGYEGLTYVVEPLKCHAWPAVDFAFGMPDTAKSDNLANMAAQSAMKGLQLQVRWIVEKLEKS